VGIRTKKMYRIGDNVEVIVKNASKTLRTVDFVLLDDKTKKIYAKQ
jgi:hypothetical protein